MEIPEQVPMTQEQAFERLQVWFGMQQQLGDLKTAEVLARKTLVEFYFPDGREGTNRVPASPGYDLIGVLGFTRNVDEAALNALNAADLKFIQENAVPMNELFVQKWELRQGAYNTLNAVQRKFVDKLLDIKPSTPQLSIGPASNTAGQQAHAAAADAAAAAELKHNIHIGKEEDTSEDQYFRDAEGVWWFLTGEQWYEVENMTTLEELEAQHTVMTTKPKRTRKPRATKGNK